MLLCGCMGGLTWLWDASQNTDWTTLGLLVQVLMGELVMVELVGPGELVRAACTISGCKAELFGCGEPEAPVQLLRGSSLGGLLFSAVLLVRYLQHPAGSATGVRARKVLGSATSGVSLVCPGCSGH